ncbi:MAG: EamA family transporter RarD [Thalassovita sp.]
MTHGKSGILALVGACTIWGLSGLFYKLLAHIPPIEVLAHRTFWSFVFFALILVGQGRLRDLFQAIKSPRSALVIFFAAFMIGANWFLFIMSIQISKAMEASLGYYLFPLVAVLFGVLFFGERLGRMQVLAVGLAALAVSVLTIGLGVAPWVALLISFSFGIYGVVKKKLTLGPVVSVTAEVMLLCPIALTVMYLSWSQGQAAYGANLRDTVLLMISGPITATPLILFSFATKRVALGTVGLVQYLNPTLQFLCAVLVFGEPFGQWHAIAFGLIWTALAIYSVATLRQDRLSRKVAMAASGVSTVVKNPKSDGSAKP